MKISLPLKLGIFVVVTFAVVIAACLLWTPVRVRWYLGKFHSSDPQERVKGVDGLLLLGKKGKKVLAKELGGGEKALNLLIDHWINVKEYIYYLPFPESSYMHVLTPLHLAAGKGYKVVAELFIAKGAEINAKDEMGRTPLHWAGEKAIAELLIARGAEVDAKDNIGSTPLHRAAFGGNKAIAELLITRGAEVNARKNDNWTPLHWAAIRGHKAVAELLVTKGADVNIKDEIGRTPLDVAIADSESEIATLLRSHGGRTGEELREAKK